MAKDYDPSMHTVEHVLNQTMVRLFGTDRCFSSHLNSGKSKCDYRFDRDLTEAEGNTLEETVNAVLTQKLPVTVEEAPAAEAGKAVNLSRLPADVARSVAENPEAPVRLVRIGDYDVCPCIGAHLKNTAEAGTFRLVSHSWTPPKEGETEKGVLRLRFKLS